MHPNVREALEKALSEALTLYARKARPTLEPHLVWKRKHAGSWTVSFELKPSLRALVLRNSPELDALAEKVQGVFQRHYPKYLGMIGAFGMLSRFGPRQLLTAMVAETWKRQGELEPAPNIIAAIVDEVEAAVDEDTVPLNFVAPLINFRIDAPAPPLPLPGGITIRQLTEEEVTELYGGPADTMALRDRPHRLQEFAMVGSFREPKRVDTLDPGESPAYAELKKALDSAVMSLRIFKTGPVGYDGVHFSAARFTPFFLARVVRTYGNEYVPFGTYRLAADDLDLLRSLAENVATKLDVSLELACLRLAASEIRIDPRDRIIDAVTGLEAVLLSSAGDKGDHGELSFRLSLNYATLEDDPKKRPHAFSAARNIYALRSNLLHGRRVDQKAVKPGEKRVPLAEVADQAVEMLRGVVKRFLPAAAHPPYRTPGFWESRYFSVPQPPDSCK